MPKYFPILMIFGKDLCPIFPILQFSAYLAILNAQFSIQVSCANVGIHIWCDLILPIWFWWLAWNMPSMSCTKIQNWQHVTSMTYTKWMKIILWMSLITMMNFPSMWIDKCDGCLALHVGCVCGRIDWMNYIVHGYNCAHGWNSPNMWLPYMDKTTYLEKIDDKWICVHGLKLFHIWIVQLSMWIEF
jgi:hypothetical protein